MIDYFGLMIVLFWLLFGFEHDFLIVLFSLL